MILADMVGGVPTSTLLSDNRNVECRLRERPCAANTRPSAFTQAETAGAKVSMGRITTPLTPVKSWPTPREVIALL
jgi:hypothetical protein